MKIQNSVYRLTRRYFYLFAFYIFILSFGYSQTITESFDSGFPTSWKKYSADSTYFSLVSAGSSPTQTPHSGSGELMWNSYNAPAGSNAGIISPKFDLSGLGTNTSSVNFWFYRDVTAYDSPTYDGEGVSVYINTTPSKSGATLLGFIPRRGGLAASGPNLVAGATLTASVSNWYQYGFSFPAAFRSCTNYLIFDFTSKYGNNCFMDDISFSNFPSMPSINMAVSNTITCVGKPITIYNLTTNACSVDHFSFYYQDATIDSLHHTTATFTHSYSATGMYFIQMTAYGPGNVLLGSASSPPIIIGEGSSGDFLMSNDTICPGDSIYFEKGTDSSPMGWEISDGYTTPFYSFFHKFSTVGVYDVKLKVYTACGLDSIIKQVVVTNSIAYNPNFTKSKDSLCVNSDFTFSPAQLSGNHLWNFGDGTTSTAIYSSHQYTALGTYTVSHELTSLCGVVSTKTLTVKVVNSIVPLYAYFSVSPNLEVCPGVQLYFDSPQTDGTLNWNFGDGNSHIGNSPTHTYSVTGTYSVNMMYTNKCGNSLSQMQVVTVTNTVVPNTNFIMLPNPACLGDSVGFSYGEGNALAYFWNFGDGTTSTSPYLKHKYVNPGKYAVTYKITNQCGNQGTKIDTVYVNPKSSTSMTLLSCGPLQFNTQTYTVSGTYQQHYYNHYGCDSILNLNLTIINLDTSVTQTSGTLHAGMAGATYQWLDCSAGYSAVPGATLQSFSPGSVGDYALAITNSVCSDTSSCHHISVLAGLKNYLLDPLAFNLYPNPAKDKIMLTGYGFAGSILVTINSIYGQVIYREEIIPVGNKLENELNLNSFAKGIYFVNLEHNGGKVTKKLIIE